MFDQRVLKSVGEELGASVCLDALYGKRELLEHALFEDVDGVDGNSCVVESDDAHAGAVVYGGELVQSFADLAVVDLHPMPGMGRL